MRLVQSNKERGVAAIDLELHKDMTDGLSPRGKLDGASFERPYTMEVGSISTISRCGLVVKHPPYCENRAKRVFIVRLD